MINYQKELDKLIDNINREDYIPTILLHACCAPCSSYCLEYLSEYFNIHVLFYNPNITEVDEYNMRKAELKRYINECNYTNTVDYIEGDYEPDKFFVMASGLELCEEGNERCHKCYEMRMRTAAKLAATMNCDYFCTTLSISPLKNSTVINTIGYRIQEEEGILWLPSDFKKKNGFKRSIELSSEHNLYRQNYCGCIYSKRN